MALKERPDAPKVEVNAPIEPTRMRYDTFVQPPAFTGPSPLHEVANALKELNPKLQSMISGLMSGMDGNEKEQALIGEAQFWTNNQEGAAEATRQYSATGGAQGIPMWGNQHVEKGYKRAQGTALSFELEGQIGQDYVTSNLRSSQDPAAYDKWFRERVSERLSPYKNDPKILAGFIPHLRSIHGKYYGQWIKDRQEYVSGVARDQFIGLAGNALDAHVIEGAGLPGGTDTAAAATSLNNIWKDAYNTGLERDKVSKLLTDTVVDKAIINRDPKLLSLMDAVTDDQGVPLAHTEYGKSKKMETAKTIQGLIHQEEVHSHQRAKWEADAKKNAKTAEWAANLAKDPNYQPSEAWLADMRTVDPDFEKGISAWRKARLERDTQEDPAAQLQLHSDIFNGGGVTAVNRALGTVIKTPESLDKAMKLAQAVEADKGKANPVLTHPTFKMLESQIIAKTQDPKWKGSLNTEPGITEGGREALRWARAQAIQWSAQNPNPTQLDVETYLSKNLGETVLRHITPAEGANVTVDPNEQARFTPPSALPNAAPPAPVNPGAAPAPQAAPPAAQRTQGPPTVIDRLVGSETPPKIGTMGLSPKQEEKVRAVAKQRGVDPQVLIDELHGRARQLQQLYNTNPGGGPKAPVPGQGQPTGNPLNPQQPASPAGAPPAKPMSAPVPDGAFDVQSIMRNAVIQTPVGNFDLANLPPAAMEQIQRYMPPEMLEGLMAQAREGKLQGDIPKPPTVAQAPQPPVRTASLDPSAGVTSKGAGGGAPVQRAMAFFKDKGLSDEDAAAFVWNFTQESGENLKTDLVHDEGTGYGIAGFRDPQPGKGRRTNLFKFAGTKNPTLEQQLEYAWHELNTTEKATLMKVLKSGTPEEKARAAIGFFRPRKDYAADRANRAGEVRKLLGGRKPTTGKA
jgi:hypothetical protein